MPKWLRCYTIWLLFVLLKIRSVFKICYYLYLFLAPDETFTRKKRLLKFHKSPIIDPVSILFFTIKNWVKLTSDNTPELLVDDCFDCDERNCCWLSLMIFYGKVHSDFVFCVLRMKSFILSFIFLSVYYAFIFSNLSRFSRLQQPVKFLDLL